MVVCRLRDVHGQVVFQSPADHVPPLWQRLAHTHQGPATLVGILDNHV